MTISAHDQAHAGTLDCVHCGLCIEHCPTYRTTGRESANPRGRIVMMRGILEERLAPTPEVMADLDLCLVCRACETACPSGVPYGSIIEQLRDQHRKRSFWRRRLMSILTSPFALRCAINLAALWQKTFLGRARRWLPVRLRKMEALLPPIPARRDRRALTPSTPATGEVRGTVFIFSGCVQPQLFPEVGRAMLALLGAAGYATQIPSTQRCCGALHAHDGDAATAKDLLQRNIDAFSSATDQPILVDAAGCGAALLDAEHRDSGPDAKAFAGRVHDALRWLTAHAEALRFRSAGGQRVSYAAPCHLAHAQRDASGPLQLVSRVPDVAFVPLEGADHCCGAAGIYNLDQPQSAEAILDERLDALERARPDVLLTGNPGCLLQWRAGVKKRGLAIRVLHPATWLAQQLESTDRPAP